MYKILSKVFIPLYAVMLPVLLMIAGCSSDSSEQTGEKLAEGSAYATSYTNVSKAPDWQTLWQTTMTASDEKPSWTIVDLSDYESFTVMMLKLQQELVPFSTDDDVIAVFVDGECRTVSPRQLTDDGDVYFVLNVRGSVSEESSEFRISYYSGALHQIFTLAQSDRHFINEYILGTDTDFTIDMLNGSTKYANAATFLVDEAVEGLFNKSDDDIVAVFVGEECRGIGHLGDTFYVFSNEASETATVRYYNSSSNRIYTVSGTFSLNKTYTAIAIKP